MELEESLDPNEAAAAIRGIVTNWRACTQAAGLARKPAEARTPSSPWRPPWRRALCHRPKTAPLQCTDIGAILGADGTRNH